ncbi:hypothetical protein ACFVFI_08065 [Streptomyces sp. NPDC057705]|uniref:hypothetical protein n=1 Tax=Streptomyces sp. NPDC057705 TaxID=3346222 RepID=UPI003688D03E
MQVDKVAAPIPLVFEWRSCGGDAKGDRCFDWLLTAVTWLSAAGAPQRGWRHLLLVRRSIADPAEVAYYPAHAHTGVCRPC